ncbi:MAG: prolyl oligopeptidase family serine peptidase [Clostridia bacterium]|nr:prolyl oligopeptidase family serine peptidase [Clostridia bacterium]
MKRIEHNESKWKFPFAEYVCNDADKKLPLIIQLHGAGERGEGGDELYLVDVHGFTEVVKDKDYECRIIMPQCPKDTFWAARVESIIKFINQLKAEFNVDEDKVYLTGMSMGGFGTWFTAMAKPELFAAIAPVCGGGMPWNAGVLTMPIWAFHGALDDVVTPRHSDEMVEKLEAIGADVTYSRVEGVYHAVWDVAYTEELLNWLLSKKK